MWRHFVHLTLLSTNLYLFWRNLSATNRMMNITAQIAAATRPRVTLVCNLLDNFWIVHLITVCYCCNVMSRMWRKSHVTIIKTMRYLIIFPVGNTLRVHDVSWQCFWPSVGIQGQLLLLQLLVLTLGADGGRYALHSTSLWSECRQTINWFAEGYNTVSTAVNYLPVSICLLCLDTMSRQDYIPSSKQHFIAFLGKP